MRTERPDRRDIERARRAALGRDPSDPALCSAPFHNLVLDSRGALWTCEAATHPVIEQAGQDLRADYETPALAGLRGASLRGELPAEHCARCLRRIERGPVERACLLLRHGAQPAAPGRPGPRTLLVQLGNGDPIALAEQVGSLFGRLRVLELAGDRPLSHPATSAILELARRQPADRRPALALRLVDPGPPDAARARLEGFEMASVTLADGDQLAERLDACRAAFGGEVALVVPFLLTPDNWADLFPYAVLCARHGARLEPSAATLTGEAPVQALELDELRVLCALLGSTWHLYAGDARPASLTGDAYELLRAEVRQIALARARDAATTPATAHLALPRYDHMLLRDAMLGSIVAKAFLGLTRSPAPGDWLEGEAGRDPDGFATALAQQPWLRVLAFRAAGNSPRPATLEPLHALYRDAGRRPELLTADREYARREGIADGIAHWHAWFGFDRLEPRTPPFAIEPAPQRPGEPRVTVLIPSYRHARYIEECVRSVLAQRDVDFAVHVCDDASPDDTAARAQAIDDARLQVFENGRNLGLGNSVLAALDRIQTPYVALLNSDDTFHPERLARCLQVLDGDGDAQLVATALRLIDAGGGEITADNTCRLLDGPNVYDWVHWYLGAQPQRIDHQHVFGVLLEHNFLATSSNLVCRTEFLRQQADELRSLKYCLDWHLFLEAARTGSLRYLPDALATYRLHPSNTVWFREGRRWSYFLEVNRVAATALQRYFDHQYAIDPHGAVSRTLAATVEHVSKNTEVFGVAMFLNQLVGALELERLSERSEPDRERIARLNATAEKLTRLSYAARDLDATALDQRLQELDRITELKAAELIADMLREEAHAQRERARRAELQLNTVQHRAWSLERQCAELTVRLETASPELAARARELHAEQQYASLREQEILRLRRGLATLRDQLRDVQRDRDELQRLGNRTANERDRLRAARDHLQGRVTDMDRIIRSLQHELRGAYDSANEARLEAGRLRGSKEMKVGHLIWNKTPLFAKSRRLAKRVLGQGRELLGRARLVLERKLQRPTPEVIKVAAGSTAQFPVISHTFVYQELTALHDMAGADVRLFHTQHGDPDSLHAAFRYLDEHRTHYVSNWDVHVADYQHYKRMRPQRTDSLMAALAAATGMSRQELEKRFELMLAFTHTRRVESWGADYVHTYFFYDQALNGLVASWILDLPRGVSTYADHMMRDWPLKVVPLHLRTAEVIVATSKRIGSELIEIGGPEIADKVIVKPNGVDGARFPFVQRQPVVDRPLRLICVSRIEPKKGMLHLAGAARLAVGRGLRIEIDVVGGTDAGHKSSEEYAERLYRKVREDGTGEVIHFHGSLKQEQIRPLLERADVFIAPFVETDTGDKDGIPTAILEAMSTGLPVIATDAGSITEIIDDGVEGLVVPQRDPEALARTIERFVTEPKLAPRLGQAARLRFEREFDIHATEPRLHARVLEAVRRRRAEHAD